MSITTRIIFMLNIFVTVIGFGQNPNALGKYFHLGIAIPVVHIRDKGHSPLTYSGKGLKIQLGFEYHRENSMARTQFSYTYGSVSPKSKPQPRKMMSNAEYNRIQFSYGYYRKLPNNTLPSDANLFLNSSRLVGATFNFDFGFNDYNLPSNNLFGYYGTTSLNISGLFQKYLDQDSTKSSKYEATMPLVSYAIRPNYIGMMPLIDGTFDLIKIIQQGKFATVNKLFHFYNRLEFQSQNKFYIANRFNYEWEFRNNTIQEPFRAIIGGFGYETLFKR
jgi:hypothetical protein